MKSFIVVLICLLIFNVSSQQDLIVMDVNGRKVTKTEFLQIYLKNNPAPKYDKQSLDEYMDLFKKFKLKVAEAELLGYDTIPRLKKELEGYRKSLAAPYLVDNQLNEVMVKQSYERLKKEIKASHILIKIGENATSADTLAAYNKLMALKKRIENGEDFATIAKTASEDPSVAQNGGDLGYFTAFQMVFPFEEAAYNTPVGKVSNPIRTKFGYHILKVFDQRPARGTMNAAHIMVATSKEDTNEEIEAARKKIFEIYDKLVAGSNFEELVTRHSDDFNTNERGGTLPPFGSGTTTRMLPEFEDAAFALKNDGDFTKPIKTPYGFHIIKRVSWKDIASFESMKKELQNKVKRDDRSKMTQDLFVFKLKSEYKYENKSAKSLKPFLKAIDTNYFSGKWKASAIKTNEVLFTLNGINYTQSQFANYLEKNYFSVPRTIIKDVVNTQFNNWEKAEILAYEESRLEEKHPDFKALMQEYHDGILLYEVMSDKVWNKASKDTAGLNQFYENNKSNYMWKDRINAVVYECATKKIADDVHKMIKTDKKDTITSKHVLDKINKDSELNLRVRTNKFEVNEISYLKGRTFIKGLNVPYEFEGKFYVLKVDEIIPATHKQFDEAKGAITSDYQNYLEKNWLEELTKKHPVKIYEDVFYAVGK
jgi:peptidyl-prolyl cis-trans isomerase SurA